MKICVVGAGVTGLTVAYCLSKRGHRVTVVDAQAGAGLGASFGNGAQLSYSYVAPLADPSVWRNLPKYLFSGNSPLLWKPSLNLHQWHWLCSFLAACNTNSSRATTISLLQLAFYSRDQLHIMKEENRLDFDFHRAGKLVMLDGPDAMDAAKRQVRFQSTFGCEQKILDVGQCIEIEPALAPGARRWVGGVYTPGEEVGDCAAFCAQLLAKLSQQFPATQFLFDTKVTKGIMKNRQLHAVLTDKGELDADAFVLSAGAGSTRFMSTLGMRLPVYPLKGYSITLPANEAAPAVSITDLARKVVYARVGQRLRVAGRVEIVGDNNKIQADRCLALKDGALEIFPGLDNTADIKPWAGQRPATPSGLPLIGPTQVKGLYLNTGHGALGWTLACGSASLLATQIDGERPAISDQAFRIHNQ
jgi:D-amino-acid dehydrogenase